jgi:hypothetical protein
LDGGEDFFVGPAVLPEAIDCFLVDAVLAAGYLHGEVQQGACLVVELGLSVVALDLLGQLIVAGESTEILPVGFGSIEAVQLTRHHHRQHLAGGAPQRAGLVHEGLVELDGGFQRGRV